MSARSLINAAALVLGLAIGAALYGRGAYTLGEYDVLPEGWDVDYV